jgi:hypothetical protein
VTCHEGLSDHEPWRCDGCSTLLHPACRQELKRCPTIGCATWAPVRVVARPAVAPAPTPTAPDKGRSCLWLALEALFMLIFLAL